MVRQESGDVIISSGAVIGMDWVPFCNKLTQILGYERHYLRFLTTPIILLGVIVIWDKYI